MSKPCNEDCFNCKFEDCILDALGRAPKAAVPEGELTMSQIRARKYYAEHREEQRAKKYAYWLAHKEENSEKRKAKYRAQKAEKAKAFNNNPIL